MSDETYQILIPSVYDKIINNIDNIRLRMNISTLLNTGMRYEELRQFDKHKKWFDSKNHAIVIPSQFTKTKRGRTIHLTPDFSNNLTMFLYKNELKTPTRISMNENLRRWCISLNLDFIPSVKTFRKTWESWLLFADYDTTRVAANQGHTTLIQLNHYLNFSSTLKSERELVKEKTRGWMT